MSKTYFVEVKDGETLDTTYRKTNTSGRLLLTVNKDTVVREVVDAPKPVESANGTRGATVTDSKLSIWTFGPKGETLRDGVHV